MPVDIADFEAGSVSEPPSVPEQVVTFLYTNREYAFTRAEIASALGADPNPVGTALSRLKARGLVRHQGTYWAITEDHDRVADAYDLHTVSERLDDADGGIDSDAWDEAAPEQPHPSERDEADA